MKKQLIIFSVIIFGLALLGIIFYYKDSTAVKPYIIMSADKQATLSIPIDALPDGIAPSDVTIVKDSVENFFMDALQSSGIKLNAEFRINTKLDDFEVSSISFNGNVGGGSQGSLRENLKNIGQKFEEFGKQLLEEKKEEPKANMEVSPTEVPAQ